MEWKDGNCWYRNYFYNSCFNKPVFLIEIKFISLKVVLKDLIKKGVSNLFVTGTCFEYGNQAGAIKSSAICVPFLRGSAPPSTVFVNAIELPK